MAQPNMHTALSVITNGQLFFSIYKSQAAEYFSKAKHCYIFIQTHIFFREWKTEETEQHIKYRGLKAWTLSNYKEPQRTWHKTQYSILEKTKKSDDQFSLSLGKYGDFRVPKTIHSTLRQTTLGT